MKGDNFGDFLGSTVQAKHVFNEFVIIEDSD